MIISQDNLDSCIVKHLLELHKLISVSVILNFLFKYRPVRIKKGNAQNDKEGSLITKGN